MRLVVDTLPSMRFQWDWLRPVVTVPYVPTLGPVGPGALSAELFNAIADVADTSLFLPYDKDRRWSNTKNEQVIVNEIIHEPDRTVIPTLSTRGRGLVKIHYYGDSAPRLSEATAWSRTWCATSVVAGGRAGHLVSKHSRWRKNATDAEDLRGPGQATLRSGHELGGLRRH